MSNVSLDGHLMIVGLHVSLLVKATLMGSYVYAHYSVYKAVFVITGWYDIEIGVWMQKNAMH